MANKKLLTFFQITISNYLKSINVIQCYIQQFLLPLLESFGYQKL